MMESIPRLGRTLAAFATLAFSLSPVSAQSGSGLTLPGGYDSVAYSTDFSGPITALTLDAQNRVFASQLSGEILILVDANQDGISESTTHFFDNLLGQVAGVTDILFIGPKLYVCHLGGVTTLEDTNADDVADVVTPIVTGLPYGLHQSNGLLFDPPNHLLISIGSATDLGPEPNPLSASVLRCDLTGANLVVHASGIRNCFRMARHPVTGDVVGTDNEWNAHPTETLKGDEINIIVAGGVYGFWTHFGLPAAPGEVAPLFVLPQHVAPTGLAFNPNGAITGYRDEIYMTLFTQGNSASVIRVPVLYGPISGTPKAGAELFASGFVNPIDVEFLPNGSMLVADFSGMTVHRIFPKSDATLTIMTTPSVGTTCPIRLRSPSHPGALVYMGASLAPQPPVVLGGTNLVVYLDISSPVFQISVTPGNGYFNFPIPGNLNALGDYYATLAIPAVPALVGLDVWLSYVVLDPALLPLAVSPEQKVTIAPLW